MIRLFLDQHGPGCSRGESWTRPGVLVDLVEEGYAVDLTIELDPGEAAPFLPPEKTDGEADVVGVSYDDDPLARAQGRVASLSAELAAARAEIEDLRRYITTARDRPSINRTLLPDEARALASMLVHYAREAERRR